MVCFARISVRIVHTHARTHSLLSWAPSKMWFICHIRLCANYYSCVFGERRMWAGSTSEIIIRIYTLTHARIAHPRPPRQINVVSCSRNWKYVCNDFHTPRRWCAVNYKRTHVGIGLHFKSIIGTCNGLARESVVTCSRYAFSQLKYLKYNVYWI